ncbi:hypothetical protein CAEBREN_17021 [Caenorhabditis brenneri]|uniref:Peptidase M12A domain-containing protein n=1 Tax=Caenorhabditis brenneri TaxID=135651 RepID=G0NQE0_CAEBE|nr:hypothetical protein CAEBREN_17021 [Caenorhabditis brenneri]
MRMILGLLLLVNFALSFNTEHEFFYPIQYFDEDVAPLYGDDLSTEQVKNIYALPGMVQEFSQGTLSGDEADSTYSEIKLTITHSCDPSIISVRSSRANNNFGSLVHEIDL